MKIWKNHITEIHDLNNLPENVELEPKQEIGPDEKGKLKQTEGGKAIKEMRDKKATREDDVPADALKLLGEDGLRLITHKINNIYETEEWLKDFIEFTMTALEKKSKATKCRNHHTISFIALTAKTVARIL
jgi:hypothetical protein